MTRVLVVEDEDSIRDAVSFMLRKEGYEVITAADGVAAVSAYEREGENHGEPRPFAGRPLYMPLAELLVLRSGRVLRNRIPQPVRRRGRCRRPTPRPNDRPVLLGYSGCMNLHVDVHRKPT